MKSKLAAGNVVNATKNIIKLLLCKILDLFSIFRSMLYEMIHGEPCYIHVYSMNVVHNLDEMWSINPSVMFNL